MDGASVKRALTYLFLALLLGVMGIVTFPYEGSSYLSSESAAEARPVLAANQTEAGLSFLPIVHGLVLVSGVASLLGYRKRARPDSAMKMRFPNPILPGQFLNSWKQPVSLGMGRRMGFCKGGVLHEPSHAPW